MVVWHPQSRIDESVRRVLTLKRRLGLLGRYLPDDFPTAPREQPADATPQAQIDSERLQARRRSL